MMKKVYSCDICRDNKKPEFLVGCCFSDLHNFALSEPDKTDGTHICTDCLAILKKEILKMGAKPGYTHN